LRKRARVVARLFMGGLLAACLLDTSGQANGGTALDNHDEPGKGANDPRSAAIDNIVREAETKYSLKSIIVQVTSGGQNIYAHAFGESMTGVARNSRHAFS
jgi:hypothetical protein